MMRKIILTTITCLICAYGFSQKKTDFRFWEDSLIRLRDQVIHCQDETQRFALNEDFMNLLESILWEQNSFKFTWDSVRNFAVVASPDNLFKIFTWHVWKDNYTVENFGFLHVYNDGRKKYVIFPLYDKRNMIDYPESLTGDHNMWYGAVYYQIVPLQTRNKTYYTLLGWNANNLFTNQKVIEILQFKKDKTPLFGAKIFKNYPGGKVARVILEYSKDASLSLKYEKHAYDVGTGKRDPKTKRVEYETKESDMIIFDHLIPMDETMPQIPSFMVPESSLNQAFIPEEGKWLFLSKVKGRNPDVKLEPFQPKPRDYYRPN